MLAFWDSCRGCVFKGLRKGRSKNGECDSLVEGSPKGGQPGVWNALPVFRENAVLCSEDLS